ncbi:MAG: amidohydrolase family protein [Candidatus Azambacteria bacterium]|nr:amidohydrolase family protein [Candidatus Azambacteria bacterium]
MALDILIKNGTVVDGLGTSAYRADVAIKNGKIERIGLLGRPSAKTTIDATGLYVTPGFIDINNASDRYWTLFNHPNLESHLYQGVTTIIGGNCGSSLAPLTTGEIILNIQKWADTTKINVNWLTVREFLEETRKKKLLLNFGTLIGHSTLRRGIVRDEFRDLSEKELAQMKNLLETGLAEGALGFSTGLNYSHAKIAPKEEINSLVASLEKGKIYSTHLRDEEAGLYESILETIEIAKKTQASVEISHFKAIGKNNWPIFYKGLEEIEKASENLDINFDIYPYTSTATVFYTLLPDWVAVGGRKKLVENLKNKDFKEKIINELRKKEGDFEGIIIASGNIDKIFIGKTIGAIAENQGKSVTEAIINLLIAAEGKLIIFWPALSEENFISALKSPLSIIASDGAAYNTEDAKKGTLAHPRSFGCFSRIISKYVRAKNIIVLEEAIKKMTALPALKAGLTYRGAIAPFYFADINVFNLELIEDTANFENPFQYARGMHAVIVNGRVALINGQIENKNLGQIL